MAASPLTTRPTAGFSNDAYSMWLSGSLWSCYFEQISHALQSSISALK